MSSRFSLDSRRPASACGKRPLFPRTPISPATALPGHGRLPPAAAPSHTPWKTLRVSHRPAATTTRMERKELAQF